MLGCYNKKKKSKIASNFWKDREVIQLKQEIEIVLKSECFC